ncbi:NeuD/PglB/VioB family sugar acetyltransferase [Cardinium endosymbiont of Culicoides punctatus]|uniref:NeuD/PglB/VioB family sugar acetyltransferase n=1 Tax=Cardinium endosymbiont of Culicoides punctatus TaxID=2304601 RepID=UPI001058CC6C|nr:NeuD/PglB/VioB family sugar acetyltransferase [Cardinium endosymbiont of Culicoides punctatus]TDG94967.1 putative acetyltransferase EpsM [Cardinium endosymbiont of Culicoides punctatus]
MSKGVIIFSVCTFTKGALDIFQKNNLIVYGILEDDKTWHNREIYGVPILGATDDHKFLELLDEECASFIAYGNIAKRKSILNFLHAHHKDNSISAVHPTAIVAEHIQLGQGNYIGAQVCLAPEVNIGNHCILNNGVIIDYQTQIHNLVQIGAGSVIGDNVIIEEGVYIGIGATIISGVTIQKGASIGAGSVVLGNVKKDDILLGNPAKSIKQSA